MLLGATAAKALLGSAFSVTKKRAVPIESEWAPTVFATVHPSAVLRAPKEKRSDIGMNLASICNAVPIAGPGRFAKFSPSHAILLLATCHVTNVGPRTTS